MDNSLDKLFSKQERLYKEIIEANCFYVNKLNEWIGDKYVKKLKLKKDDIALTPKLLINRAQSSKKNKIIYVDWIKFEFLEKEDNRRCIKM